MQKTLTKPERKHFSFRPKHTPDLANHDDGMMETYDEAGELIASRRLRPEEKQQKLFSLSKTAN